MRSDQGIYNDIGPALLSLAFENALKIIFCAKLEPESDCGEFTYDYIDKQGVQDWVTDTENSSEKLLELLFELRNFFVDDFNKNNHSGMVAKP